jgi:hypothetical protein
LDKRYPIQSLSPGSSCEPLGPERKFRPTFFIRQVAENPARIDPDKINFCIGENRPFQPQINVSFIMQQVSGGESLKGWVGTQVPTLFFCPRHFRSIKIG